MSLYVRQTDTRSQLQDKLAKELQEKAREKAKAAEQPDGVEDSRYIEGTKKTTSLAWVWGLIFLAIIGIVVWLIIASTAFR